MLLERFALLDRHRMTEAAPPRAAAPSRRPRIGLALGGGAARGWAHIGVLRVLVEAGYAPDIIAGCSIGAVVGGCYAAGKLDEIEAFARSLTKSRVLGLLDFRLHGAGLIGGDRLRRLLERDLGDRTVESLPIRFASVATELGSGHELWLGRGSLVDAIRASYALPGVFDPVRLGGRTLIDGALVNPVPVTVARAFGADLVVCANLNGDIRLRGTVIQSQAPDERPAPAPDAVVEAVVEGRRWRRFIPGLLDAAGRTRPKLPVQGIASVMIDAFNITQDRISRSRLAGDPPDVMIAPKLGAIGLFEFHRAAECIAQGRDSALRSLPSIREALDDHVAIGRDPYPPAVM